MHRSYLVIAVLPALLAANFQVRATSCAAGNANTSTLAESTPSSAFVINSDGTATHTLTGLMWKRCVQSAVALPPCAGGMLLMNWQDALTSAARDTTAGYTDWRLPNAKELASIVERCGTSPSINKSVFLSNWVDAYWTSSSSSNNGNSAWYIEFLQGNAGVAAKTGTNFVRLVRGGRPVNAFDAQTARNCNADIDGNGQIDALTDGLLFSRALFGLTGTAVTNGALGVGAARSDWEAIRTFMNLHCGTNF